MRHDLLNQLTEDGEQHEDSKHLVLKSLLTELSFEKRKSNK
jgi:hypothetical protein